MTREDQIKGLARAAALAGIPIHSATAWFEGVVVLQHLIRANGNCRKAGETLGVQREHVMRLGRKAGLIPWGRRYRKDVDEDD